MNSRERVIRAIEFKGPDRVPLLHGVLPAALLKHGRPLIDLLDEFESDFGQQWAIPDVEKLGPCYRKGTHADEWGVLWRNERDGMMGIAIEHPLSDWSDYQTYRFPPNPGDEWFASLQEEIRDLHHEHYVMAGGMNLFERMQFVRGYEELMCDLALDAKEAHILRDRLVDHALESIHMAVKTDIDGLHFADDWGTQVTLIISPAAWRRFFKPAYARMFEPCKAAGKHIHFHSDGVTSEIMHDLVEIGVDVLNVQHSIMGLKRIAGELGGKVAFRSDLDRQHILPHGTREEIRAHVREVVEALGSYNGGLIGHGEIAPDVPLENVRAMLEAWREFGTYA